PYCDEDAETCVACLDDEHCAESSVGSVGHDESHACVECQSPSDCQSATASARVDDACAPCSQEDECGQLDETPVCAAGEGMCVECLDESDCGGHVCAPQTHTCTNRLARSLFACEACDHDLDCQEGQLCVEQTYDDGGGLDVIGTFCTWTKEARVGGGTCSSAGKPFALSSVDPVGSVDGVSAVLCVPRTTTCPAFLHHSQAVAGCNGPMDSAACGAPDSDDGLCRLDN